MPTWSGSECIRAREWRQAGKDKQVRPRRSSMQLAAACPAWRRRAAAIKRQAYAFELRPGLGMSAGAGHMTAQSRCNMHAGLQRHAAPAAEAEAEAAPAGSLWMDVSGHHPHPFRLILPPPSAPLAHTDTSHGTAAGCRLAGSQRSPSIDVRAMNGTPGNRHGFGERKGRRG
nr:hypothetical protein SEVIR_7G212800v2 [Setaria viridis]